MDTPPPELEIESIRGKALDAKKPQLSKTRDQFYKIPSRPETFFDKILDEFPPKQLT
jgi:hypothetical protein